MPNLLPSALADVPHLAAIDEVAEARFAAVELQALLVYLMDTVPVEALPWLAAQFDILGIKGYGFAQTEAERRAVLRQAIELHRYKGTPWAIKEAVRKYGYTIASLQERVGNNPTYNAAHFHNGTIRYGGTGHWTLFRVLFDTVLHPTIPAGDLTKIIEIINEYKPARSHLEAVVVSLGDIIDDISADISDDVTGLAAQLAPVSSITAYYNGRYTYNGTRIHQGIDDDGAISVLPVLWSPSQIPALQLQLWLRPESIAFTWQTNGHSAIVANGSTTVTVTGGTYTAGTLISLDGGATSYRITAVSGTTLTIATAFTGTGGGGLLVSVPRVLAWADSSTHGRTVTATATAAGGTTRPLYKPPVAGQNGFPCVWMSREMGYQITPIAGANNPMSLQMVAVVRNDATNNNLTLFSHQNATARVNFLVDSSRARLFTTNSTSQTGDVTANTNQVAGFNIHAWQFNQNEGGPNDVLRVWNNGNLTQTSNSYNYGGNYAATTQFIGLQNSNNVVNNGFAGDVLEMIVLENTSLSDLQRVEGFLAWKYNIVSLLPAGHPFKNAHP